MNILAEPNKVIRIGKVAENEYTTVKFDIKSFLSIFPNASFELFHKRRKDDDAYPCTTEIDNDFLLWTVTESDLAYVGEGEAQIIVTNGDIVAKSNIYKTLTVRAISTSEDPPESYQAWVNSVIAAKNSAESSAIQAIEAKDDVFNATATDAEIRSYLGVV